MTSHRVEDDRVVAVYPKDAQLLGRLRELIALEGGCCSFLCFDVEERPDAVVTELRLPRRAPGRGENAVPGLRRLISRAARPG